MTTRDLEGARSAFEERDPEASRMAHLAKAHALKEKEHQKEGGAIVSSLVFGGLDGIVTTFAVLVAAVVQGLSIKTLLILTFGNLIGDAVGMSVGDWLSSVAEDKRDDKDREDMRRAVLEDPEREMARLAHLYEKQGLKAADAREVVTLLMENQDAFIDTLCVYELGIMPAEQGGASPLRSAIVTFFSFALCSAVPMLAYVFCFRYTAIAGPDYLFGISLGLFAVTLFVLGAVKGRITNTRWWLSGIVCVGQGLVTAGAAYGISYGFEQLEFIA